MYWNWKCIAGINELVKCILKVGELYIQILILEPKGN
jgi:hypothetical protein